MGKPCYWNFWNKYDKPEDWKRALNEEIKRYREMGLKVGFVLLRGPGK